MTLARAVRGVSASRVESRRGERYGRRSALTIHPRGRQRASFFTPKIDVCTADKYGPTRRRSVGQTRKECSWRPDSLSTSLALLKSAPVLGKQCSVGAATFTINLNAASLLASRWSLTGRWSLA